jgi:hypothetical protein
MKEQVGMKLQGTYQSAGGYYYYAYLMRSA